MDWATTPAPGEDTIPAPAFVLKAGPDAAGLWVDGVRGWQAPVHMVRLAIAHGYPISEADQALFDWVREGELLSDTEAWTMENWQEFIEEVETWFNDAVAPEGYSFGWHDGDFMLWSESSWCNAGDSYGCTEPNHAHD